jgi:hypothetical protein
LSVSHELVVGDENVHPRLRRDYVTKKLLDFEILYLIGNSAQTGYSLRKALQAEFGNKVSFGTVYPHLKSLWSRGMIRPDEERLDYEPSLEQSDSNEPHGKRAFVLTTRGAREYSAIENDLLKISGLIQRRFSERKYRALMQRDEKQPAISG